MGRGCCGRRRPRSLQPGKGPCTWLHLVAGGQRRPTLQGIAERRSPPRIERWSFTAAPAGRRRNCTALATAAMQLCQPFGTAISRGHACGNAGRNCCRRGVPLLATSPCLVAPTTPASPSHRRPHAARRGWRCHQQAAVPRLQAALAALHNGITRNPSRWRLGCICAYPITFPGTARRPATRVAGLPRPSRRLRRAARQRADVARQRRRLVPPRAALKARIDQSEPLHGPTAPTSDDSVDS